MEGEQVQLPNYCRILSQTCYIKNALREAWEKLLWGHGRRRPLQDYSPFKRFSASSKNLMMSGLASTVPPLPKLLILFLSSSPSKDE